MPFPLTSITRSFTVLYPKHRKKENCLTRKMRGHIIHAILIECLKYTPNVTKIKAHPYLNKKIILFNTSKKNETTDQLIMHTNIIQLSDFVNGRRSYASSYPNPKQKKRWEYIKNCIEANVWLQLQQPPPAAEGPSLPPDGPGIPPYPTFIP